MFGKLYLGSAAFALALAPTMALANSTATLNMRLVVPVQCSVKHDGMLGANSPAGAVSLGSVREYCNASHGYELVMTYTPGSLNGATIQAGDKAVVLDGSGRVVLSREFGPKVQMRALSIVPGANGIDTDRLDIDIIPNQG